jgi:hypothetical protein
MRDLGLSYEAAMHGVQSAVRFEMSKLGLPDEGDDSIGTMVRMMKHLRVGIDGRASDAGGLAGLLIKKGLITMEEYAEHLRLAANEELARYQEHCQREYGLPSTADFR